MNAPAASPAAQQFAREGYLICRQAIPALLRDFIATEYQILYNARRLKIDAASWWWRVPPYTIGGIASFWVVQRVAAF